MVALGTIIIKATFAACQTPLPLKAQSCCYKVQFVHSYVPLQYLVGKKK